MNDKEIGEIRRHLRRDRSNITKIYGCFVNDNKEIITEFGQSTGIMPENEGDKYFALFKRVLSGSVGKNLIDITFKTSQVAGSPEHKLLMDLRESKLGDDELLHSFFQKIIDSVTLEGNYLILIGCDSYDVPFKGKDDLSDSDKSEEVYTYLICAICPVKQTKPNLHYVPEEKLFHDGAMNQPVSAPALGFLFPAFDNRSANIYNALFYSRKEGELHQEFIDAVFHIDLPMSAAEQREAFESALSESLGSACSLEIMQAIHGQLAAMIEEHRETKDPEPLTVSPCEVSKIILDCGASEEQAEAFQTACGERFGVGAVLNPANLIDAKRVELKTEKVSLSIDPEYSHLVEAKVIDGQKVLIVPVEDHLEFNGVAVNVNKDKE